MIRFLLNTYLIVSISTFAQAEVDQTMQKASIKTALVSSVEGIAQVLTPGPDVNGKAMLVFEGLKYHFDKLKIGQKLISGQVVMTASDGKVKIVYDHGDVVIVGPSSSLSIPSQNAKNPKVVELDLKYGKFRAMIDKEGPLSGLKIRTPVAVAGVRGTDFYMNYFTGQDQTVVQVLRGEVEVKSSKSIKGKSPGTLPEKTTLVKAGEIGKVEIAKATEVKTASKEDLARVQSESTVAKITDENITKEVRTQIDDAEKRAVKNIMNDIKRYDPQTAQKLAEKSINNVEDLNTNVVYDLYKTAPAGPSRTKPNLKDFDDKTEDVYQKYFKPLQK